MTTPRCRRTTLASGLAAGVLALSCSGEERRDLEPSGSASACDTEAAPAPASDVSFERDVMPLFGRSCVMSQCHNARDARGELYLGPPCRTAPGSIECVYPESPDGPDLVRDPQPLTEEILSRVHTALLEESATVTGTARVEPGDPGTSFLVDKLAGTQARHGTRCRPLPYATTDDPCGGDMPVGARPCEDAEGRARFETVVAWIRQGARR